MPEIANITREGEMDLSLYEYISSLPGGEKTKECIQCGNCSGSCPTSYMMDYPPRQIFAMIRAGLREKVLASNTMWYCCSCYTCAVRCPKGIEITDVMYALKNLSLSEEGIPKPDIRLSAFSESFIDIVNSKGRNHETSLILRFYLKTNPFGIFKNTFLGLNLFTHGRLPLFGKKIKDIKGLRKIIKKVTEIEEAKKK